jgi:hypothetical protein
MVGMKLELLFNVHMSQGRQLGATWYLDGNVLMTSAVGKYVEDT